MATVTPATVQNENIHILRGKGIEGAKLGIVQNENIHIHKGKGIESFKAEKPKPVKRQERKALVDLSHTGKPLISTAAANRSTALKDKPNSIKGMALKEKSTVEEKCTAKKASRSNVLTDEEVKKCIEWANEGIEHMHFPGNDMDKLEAHQHEKRVKKKVDKAMSAFRGWNDKTFGLNIPQDIASDDKLTLKLKFEPEILSPCPTMLPTKPDYDDIDNLFNYDESDYDSLYLSQQYDLKLKEEF